MCLVFHREGSFGTRGKGITKFEINFKKACPIFDWNKMHKISYLKTIILFLTHLENEITNSMIAYLTIKQSLIMYLKTLVG